MKRELKIFLFVIMVLISGIIFFYCSNVSGKTEVKKTNARLYENEIQRNMKNIAKHIQKLRYIQIELNKKRGDFKRDQELSNSKYESLDELKVSIEIILTYDKKTVSEGYQKYHEKMVKACECYEVCYYYFNEETVADGDVLIKQIDKEIKKGDDFLIEASKELSKINRN